MQNQYGNQPAQEQNNFSAMQNMPNSYNQADPYAQNSYNQNTYGQSLYIQETPVQTFNSQNSELLVYTPVKASPTSGPLWRIQLGSFTREENAMRLVVKLRKIKFEPAYEKTETHIRVVLYGIRPNDLERIKDILEKNDFTDYVLRQESW